MACLEGHVGDVCDFCTDGLDWVWSCGWDKKMLLWDAGVSKHQSISIFIYIFMYLNNILS